MPSDTPVAEVAALLDKGMTKAEVSQEMEAKGYNLQQISDAMNQADIRKGVEGTMPPQNMQPSTMEEEIPLAPEEGEVVQQQQPAQPMQQDFSQQQYMQPQTGYGNGAYPSPGVNYEDMQALVEQIVEEKWKEIMRDVGDIGLFKSRMMDDMEAVKQEILRTNKRLEDLQVAVLGKVKDYNKSVMDITNEMKALEQVFGKIIEPLAMNVKELARITEELKR